MQVHAKAGRSIDLDDSSVRRQRLGNIRSDHVDPGNVQANRASGMHGHGRRPRMDVIGPVNSSTAGGQVGRAAQHHLDSGGGYRIEVEALMLDQPVERVIDAHLRQGPFVTDTAARIGIQAFDQFADA